MKQSYGELRYFILIFYSGYKHIKSYNNKDMKDFDVLMILYLN